MTKDYNGPERRKKLGTVINRSSYDWTKINIMRESDKTKRTPEQQADDIVKLRVRRERQHSTLTPAAIRSIRNSLGLTQKEFGEEMGVSKTTVYQWERGERIPSRTSEKLIFELSNKKSADVTDF